MKKGQRFEISLPIILINTFFIAGYYVANSLTGAGVNEVVKFQLLTSWEGTGYGEFIPQLILALLYILITIALLLIASKKATAKNNYFVTIVGLIAILINPATSDFYEWFRPYTHFDEIDSINISKLKNNSKVVITEKPRSFIYIYAESFERTFFNEDIFPGLITELKKNDSTYIDFKNVEQVYGTGSTMMGMVASQCGVFSVPSITGKFMGGISCLGNKLQEAGYDLQYIQGGALDFAGTRQFYKNHGFKSLTGINFFRHKYKEDRYFSQWGVYDEYLLEESYQRYLKLKSQNKPFGLFLVTLDTHYPKGHKSPLCDLKYKDGKNPYLNSIKCSDRNIANFIRQILEEDNGETLIILASDHLALKTTASHLLKSIPRRNLLRFYNIEKQDMNNLKPASTLDIGTTLLHALGIDDRLGMGVNLFSNEKTLLERYERKTNNFLRSLTPKIEEASLTSRK
ncbi:sulfatase-like hydrolase/transferase [Bacteriovorax sp. BAL6_X]|uniref:sulfatase-like hydrolase/transferase n=1 Tax=Bacteriovorax sp. BAL6_X TaxID=1201290 RepID=UPI0018DD96D8|nr:sulfatase-like hydrolase/transferase [Bacteriovorax sp. BAL6_X]